MKRLLLLIIACLWASCAWAYTNWFIGAVTSEAHAPTGDTCTGGLLFSWHAETTDVTTGTPAGCSVGDTTPTAVSAVVLSSAWAADGTYSVSVPTGGDYYEFDITGGDIGNRTSGTILITLQTKATTMSANAPILSLYDTVSTNRIAVSPASDPSNMKLRYVGNGTDTVAITSGANLQISTSYDVVVKWDINAATKLYVSVNGVSGTSASAITTMTNQPNKLYIGDSSFSMSGYKVDKIKIYDSWLP